MDAAPAKRDRTRHAWRLMQMTLNSVNELRRGLGESPLAMKDVHHLSLWELCEQHLWPLQARARTERSRACG